MLETYISIYRTNITPCASWWLYLLCWQGRGLLPPLLITAMRCTNIAIKTTRIGIQNTNRINDFVKIALLALIVMAAMSTVASAAKSLTITLAGTGTGTVNITDTTNPANSITCTATCTVSGVGNNDVGNLSASANSNSTFAGWSLVTGGLSGCVGTSSPCSFSMNNKAQSVTATFTLNPSPSIVSFAPPTPVNDPAGTTRTFSITTNQTVNVTWYINGTSVKTDTSTVSAGYTNTSSVLGVWNVSAVARNPNGTVSQQWLWSVSESFETIDVTLSNVPVNFGNVSAGSSNQPALLPLNVTIQNTTNVNVNLTLNGSSFTYGAYSFGVGNMTYSNSSAGTKTSMTASFPLPPYADWINIAQLVATNRSIYLWISIPPGQSAGAYSSTITVLVEKYS